MYEIPEGTKNAKGRAIQNLLNIDSDDVVTAYLRVKSLNDTEFINSHYVLFCTKNGVIKKTLLEQYSRPRQNGVNAITIREDDKVIEVRMTMVIMRLSLLTVMVVPFVSTKVRFA